MDRDSSPENRTPSSKDSINGDDHATTPAVSIPDHQLLRRIGRGSYGEVWVARSSMGMLRAVKIVHRKSFQNKRPFERELSGIRKFEPISRSHEGFIDVLHAGINEEEGYFYYIMELGDDVRSGQNIDPDSYSPRTLGRELAPTGKMPIQGCVTLGLGLSQALAELHKHGLVHRDIKPSNIIFVNGVAKLADIGLVAGVNEAQSYVGTEGFIPPEGPGSPQADIYGLGKVLYEASTGRDRQDFPDLPTNWDTGPEYATFLELNEVILEACKTDLQKRYQSASDMHADLVLVSNGKSVKRLKLLERRWAKIKGLAAASALTVLVGAAIGYHFYLEWRTRFESRQRQVGANVVNGTRAIETADPFAALPYFAKALVLDKGDKEEQDFHRLRFGSTLAQCPKLEQLIFSPTPLSKISLNSDGTNLLGVWKSHEARIFNLETSSVGSAVFPREQVFDIAYSPDGLLAMTAEDDKACVWRVGETVPILTLPHTNRVLSAIFSADGKHILTCGRDGIVRLWDSQTSKLEHSFIGHTAPVSAIAFSPDGNLIATGGQDGMAIVWNTLTEKVVAGPFEHGTNVWIYEVAFSADNKTLVTACSNHKARVYELATSRPIMPDLDHGAPVMSVEFSPDGRFILTASLDGTARLWLANTHQPVNPAGTLHHSGRVMDAIFTREGNRIITCCDDGTIRVWNLAGAELLPRGEDYGFSQDASKFREVHDDVVAVKGAVSRKTESQWTNMPFHARVQLNRTGKFTTTYSLPQTNKGAISQKIESRDSATGELLGPELVVSNNLKGVFLDDQGKWLASFGGKSFQIWNPRTGEPLWSTRNQEEILSVFISSDSQRIGFWSTNFVRVWDVASGKELFLPLKLPYEVRYATFSPDGKLFATCTRDEGFTRCPAQIWDTVTGKPLPFQLIHDDGIVFVSFSPDSRRIATGSEDFTARVWDVKTGKPLTPPMKHRERVNTVVFSVDGKWILTASADKTVRIWNSWTGEPLTPPFVHLAPVRGARFVTLDHGILTWDRNQDERIWEIHLTDMPASEVIDLGDVLTGGSINPDVQMPSTDLKALQIKWQHLKGKYPALFSISPDEVSAWHEAQVLESEVLNQWVSASFHLKQLLSVRPNDEALLNRLSAVEDHLKSKE